MRNPLIVASATALAIAVPSVVAYGAAVAVQERRGVVSAQAYQQRTQDVSTKSSRWQTFAMTGAGQGEGSSSAPLIVVAKGVMTVTVSADITGAPVRVRVLNHRNVLRPSVARFHGSGGDTSRSFSFVAKGSAEYRCHALAVQWRSPSGERVESSRSAVHVTYNGKRDGLGVQSCQSLM